MELDRFHEVLYCQAESLKEEFGWKPVDLRLHNCSTTLAILGLLLRGPGTDRGWWVKTI